MKRDFSQNKLGNKNTKLNKLKILPKDKLYNKNIKKTKEEDNRKQESSEAKPNSIFNIDLFTGVKEEFEKDKHKNNNIYLNFYNKHTKNQVLQKESKMSKKYFDLNAGLIKEKQEKYRIKKEEEEKIRKQKEREDSNEYRKEQMKKLYKVENIYKREISKRKNKNEKIQIIAKNKSDIDNKKLEINKINSKKNENGNGNDKEIVLTRKEYDKKLEFFIKQTRLSMNELEKLPIANKTNKISRKESYLNKCINELQGNLFKYQNHIGITVVD